MSLLERLGPKPGLTTPQAPGVERQLKAAKASLAALESRHGDAALAALLGEDGGHGGLESLNRELATARQKLEMLEAAHAAAIARDAAALNAQRAALRKTQRLAQRKHLEARDRAAAALSTALADAVRAYHAMYDSSAKVIAATPIGSTFPDGTLCSPGEVKRQVGAELYRLSSSGDSINGNRLRDFPGAMCPNMEFADNAAAIEPLLEKIRRDTAEIIEQMAEKAAD